MTSVGFDAGFYVEFECRYAGSSRSRARQTRIRRRRYHDGRGDGAQRRAADVECRRRSVAGDQDGRRPAGRSAGETAGRPRLGLGRLRRRNLAPAARCAGAAHARPRHRRAVVLDRSRSQDAGDRCEGAGADAAELDLAGAGQYFRSCGGRTGAGRDCRRRCRHSQSHQLQAAVAGELLSRPAGAFGGDPRSLRPIDRRHAGRARSDPLRRRRRCAAAGQSADRTAGGVLFRPCDRRR